MTVEHSAVYGDRDEFTLFASVYDTQKIRVQIEDDVIWMGTGENVAGTRLNESDIDELIILLMYAKTRIGKKWPK